MTNPRQKKKAWNVSLLFLLLSNILVFQLGRQSNESSSLSNKSGEGQQIFRTTANDETESDKHYAPLMYRNLPASTTSSNGSSGTGNGNGNSTIGSKPSIDFDEHSRIEATDLSSALLSIPRGEAKAMPSILVEQEEVEHTTYGGKGDKKHLGGFVKIDVHGLSPATWQYMQQTVGVKSVLDVGCGRGISTTYFLMHGLDALCVEGSHDAYMQSVLPSKETQMVEHDFSRGPWWPAKTYDAVWCVEFLEHVGRNFQKNYLPAFRKAAMLFVTHSNWGGFHHVEVHQDDWWIAKMEMYGFHYNVDLTYKIRDIAKEEATLRKGGIQPEEPYNGQHIWLNMLVFVNPAVAILPQHAHLMAEPGCFVTRSKSGQIQRRECGTGRGKGKETVLPEAFQPVKVDDPVQRQSQWEQHIRERLEST